MTAARQVSSVSASVHGSAPPPLPLLLPLQATKSTTETLTVPRVCRKHRVVHINEEDVVKVRSQRRLDRFGEGLVG